MSDERQPTMDELRERAMHVKVQGPKQRYAGTPGKGPMGATCRTCAFKVHTGLANPSKYPKCGLTHYTSGDATTIKASSPACELYRRQTPGFSWRRDRKTGSVLVNLGDGLGEIEYDRSAPSPDAPETPRGGLVEPLPPVTVEPDAT